MKWGFMTLLSITGVESKTMEDNAKLWKWTGVALLIVGLTVALVFQTVFTWGVIESTRFDQGDPALFVNSENLSSLQCPLIVTSGEVGVVSATFNNPDELDRVRIVRANISDGFISTRQEINTELPLASGETRTLTWEVTADNAVWDRFIIVRVFVLRTSANLPAMTATCSILTLDWFGLPGRLVSGLVLALSILGPLLGLGLWYTMNRPLDYQQRYQFRLGMMITTVILAGLFFSLIQLWILHIIVLMVTLILLVSLMLEWLHRLGEPTGRPQ
jgi:hypothetical protein